MLAEQPGDGADGTTTAAGGEATPAPGERAVARGGVSSKVSARSGG